MAIGTAGPVSTGKASTQAVVEYTGGMLRVAANNSSLNQILREIGRLTGMKITGGVTEDRVYGTYGPAPASKVLTSLLDGTTANVMIVENGADGPAELILTARKGGPTPPNPNAVVDSEPQMVRGGPSGPPRGEYVPPRADGTWNRPANGPGNGTGNGPGNGAPPDGSAPAMVNTDNPPAVPAASTSSDGSQPQSPNGVSTPQQIYEQLQKLRQQQQQTPQ